MPRLPQPGGDNGAWGNILNEYLSRSHEADGTIKDDTVTAAQIQDGSIIETLLDTNVQTKLNQVAPTWTTLTGKPTVIGAGSTQVAARQAIGAADEAVVEDISESIDYALLPSGSNDTTALQALIDARATAGSGTVRLRSGQTYRVAGLVMKTGVHLDLNGSTLKLMDATNASVIETLDYSTLKAGDSTDGPRDWSISNGTLDGNRSNQSGTPATYSPMLAIYGRRYTLDNLMVTNGQGTGIDSQWSTTSPFQLPNGFESYITRVFVHSCRYDGINFRGPHDTFMQNFFVVKCGDEAGAVPLRFPDSSGRANGTNVDKFHIYGGNGYNYGLLVNSGGLRVSNFVVEGSQVAQVHVQGSQVMLDGFHLYTGTIAVDTAKGIQFGDASHTGVNGCNIRGNIENCGGGWGDITYLGWNNKIDVTHFFYEDTAGIDQPDLGAVGTLALRNSIHVQAVEQGGDFRPTAGTLNVGIGPHFFDRTSTDDWRSLIEARTEEGVMLWGIDSRGRPTISLAGTEPWAEPQAGAGSGASVSLTGTDAAGTISVTTGASGVASGDLAVIYYTAQFGQNAFVALTPKNAAAAALQYYTPIDKTSLFVASATAPSPSTTYLWDYVVIGA